MTDAKLVSIAVIDYGRYQSLVLHGIQPMCTTLHAPFGKVPRVGLNGTRRTTSQPVPVQPMMGTWTGAPRR